MSSNLVNKKGQRKKLSQYAGEWLAFVDNKIIAHNDSLRELRQEIDKKGLQKRASFFLVPRKNEGPYILTYL